MWFRRDLRLSDNPALAAALAAFERVVPLFVWDPALTGPAGANRLVFLSGCVSDLDAQLGGSLVVRTGDPERIVPGVVEECGASAVFVTGDFGPHGRRRDDRVESALARTAGGGASFERVGSPYAVAPGTLHTGGGGPFQVFTPFLRAWLAEGWDAARPRPASAVLRARIDRAGLESHPSPDLPATTTRLPEPGEAAAHRAVDGFLRSASGRYRTERDRPDIDSTSRLSPYLRFGCIHPRQALGRLEPGSTDHDKFASELCWREFYADVLHNRPDAARQSYREEWRGFETDSGPEADERFEAWAQGRTGYPYIDAGMRQMLAEGWMHNRVRMAVASFLVKDLHVDWRRGARFFMEHLVDGDLASNQLNWQWVAGCGTDAAPYFRIFNPVTQGKKFDPDGEYVRRYVPELAGVPAESVHEPWRTAGSLFSDVDYPPPIVDHSAEREVSLARYAAVSGRSGPPRPRR
jgi:deoxyribodipyrimidine photo-lyase